jgi:RNA polymerase sigma-70 factor (sigma-E family)
VRESSPARPAEGWPPAPTDRTDGFAAFVAQYARGLDRLAYLLVGDEHDAEDLAAEALLAAWRHWDRVRQADDPVAYVRRIVVNEASGHLRRRAREGSILGRLKLVGTHETHDPDTAVVVDVRAALMRLPARRRACLVLRHCFQLTEYEVAETLEVNVGTVKSQTSKAVAQFRRELGDAASAAAEALRTQAQRKGRHAR